MKPKIDFAGSGALAEICIYSYPGICYRTTILLGTGTYFLFFLNSTWCTFVMNSFKFYLVIYLTWVSFFVAAADFF